jgi:hypothetical protein
LARLFLDCIRVVLVLRKLDISHVAAEKAGQRPGTTPEEARDQYIVARAIMEVEN